MMYLYRDKEMGPVTTQVAGHLSGHHEICKRMFAYVLTVPHVGTCACHKVYNAKVPTLMCLLPTGTIK